MNGLAPEPRTFQLEVKLCHIKHDDGTPELAVSVGGHFVARDLVSMDDYWKLRDAPKSDWIKSADGQETIREDHEAVIQRQSVEIAKLKTAIEKLWKCCTCGTPLPRDCPRCTSLWES